MYIRFRLIMYQGMQAEDDMTMRRSGFVVPYLSAGKVRYIIDRNSDALTLLRKMLGYTKKVRL